MSLNHKHSVYYLTFIALMTALTVAGRLVTHVLAIPNVQPMTDIILLLTISFGIQTGLYVGILSVIVSNLYLGLGPWTIAQCATYALLIILAAGLRHWSYFQEKLWLQAVFSLVAGYLYGALITLLQAPVYHISNLWVYYMTGLPYDTYHAIGNVAFYVILMPLLIELFKRSHAYFEKM